MQKFGMREPALQVVLERRDRSKNIARYYVVSVEPTLFAQATLIRRWGRIGSPGRERLTFFDDQTMACTALEDWLAKKQRRGYTPIS